MDKRLREEEIGGSESPESKRAFISPLTKQISADDLETFQKEAIFRQMNVYKRERDALRAELDEISKGADADLSAIRAEYLESKRIAERPVSDTVPVAAAVETKNGKEPTPEETPEKKSESTEKLEEEIAGNKGYIAAQCKQIKELQDRVVELEAKIRDLELAAQCPSEESLSKSEAFKHAKTMVEALMADNARLEADVKSSQLVAAEASERATNAEFEARQKSIDQIQSLEKKLDTAEVDVARLRSARDEKISEINVLKASEAERSQSLGNLKELLQIAEEKAKQPAITEQDVPEDAEISNMDLDTLKQFTLKLVKKNRILAGELPSLEQAYAKAHAKALAKIQDQAHVEAKINAANVSKTKADEKFFGAMRAKDALAADGARMKASLAKSAELLSSLRSNEQKLHASTQKLERQIADGNSRYTQLQRSYVSLERNRSEVEVQLGFSKQQVGTLQEQLKARDSDVVSATEKRRAAEAQAEKLRKQLEIKRSTSNAGSGSVQEQLESLRTVALCSLCTNNWKNTAIKSCGHVFCSDCAKSRLASRMRKCPLCNSQFGHNDLLPIHL